MKQYRVTGPSGEDEIVEAEEGTSQIELVRKAQEQAAAKVTAQPTTKQRFLGSPVGGLLKGGKDPIDAGAQLIPRAGGFVSSGARFFPNSVSNWFDKEAAALDSDVSSSEREYQTARHMTGSSGFDGWRLGGNILSPVNAAVAARMPLAAATWPQRAALGLTTGGFGGLMQPVTDTSETSFGMQKAGQIGVAALAGGTFVPILGKVVDKVMPRLAAIYDRFKDPVKASVRASIEADDAISKALKEAGIEETALPTQLRKQIADQIVAAAKKGYSPDPAALVRKADFDKLGIPYMGPQITRNPAEFSRMMNLRGVEIPGADENPIQAVLRAQNQQITGKVGALGGPRAQEPVLAGREIASALKAGDTADAARVRALYTAARGSQDAAADIPMPGLAQRVGEIADDFGIGAEKNSIPSAIYSKLKSFGFVGDDGMAQRKVFDFDAADKLLKQINSHDDGTNASLGALRSAVKEAMSTSPGGKDPFAAGRAAAASRFKAHDAIPALGKIAKATTPEEVERLGDDFVRQHIINAKPSDVRRLFSVLPADQREEARKQVARVVYQKVFGANNAGDKAARPESFQTGLNQIGTEKLKIFFTQKQVEDLQAMARISAYISQDPAASTVSRGSNLGGAMFNQLLQLSQVKGPFAATANALLNPAMKSMAIKSVMNPAVPTKANISPEVASLLESALGVGGNAAGITGLLSLPYVAQ